MKRTNLQPHRRHSGFTLIEVVLALAVVAVGMMGVLSLYPVGIKAGRKPMSTYTRKPGERHGFHWYMPRVSKTSEFPHVLSDTNFWKTFVHQAIAAAAGDPASLSLFGKPADHELFAAHVASSETWTETFGQGRTVHEWSPKPSKPDNHWFDCLVGCAVAAAMCGCKTPGMTATSTRKRTRRRKRKTISYL